MDTRSITTLKAILSEGSFQKAAERLNYSQSTVTFQIRQLENELSVQLFERIGRRMVLTQAGKEIMPYIDTIVHSMQQIMTCGSEQMPLTGELRIAVAESLLSYKIQPVIKKFIESAPRVKLALRCLNCHEIKHRIVSGELDMGIYYDIGGHPPTLELVEIGEFTGSIVASPYMDTALYDFDTMGQKKDASFVINEPQSIYREIMEEYLKKKNILVRNTIELWSIEAIKKSVASNMGFSFLPRFAVEQEVNDGILIEIGISDTLRTVKAICVHHKNKSLSKAMHLFKSLMLDPHYFKR